MKDIKFKIFASALASVLLVGCNDWIPNRWVLLLQATRKKKLLKTTQKWYRQV